MRFRWIGALLALIVCSSSLGRPAEFTTDDAAVVRIFELADQRLAVMPAVAAIKWRTQAPVFDPPRENAVIQRARELAAPMGLAGDPVGQLFALQARLAREVQSALHEEWKSHGFTYPGPVVTLASLRPKLDQLTTDILQAVYLAAPALQRDEFGAKYSGLAQQRLRAAGWTDRSREELLDVLHGIRSVPAPTFRRITASGVLRIGTTGDYAPFSVESNGVLDGSDIELAQLLAAQLHLRAVFVRTSWSSMARDLSDGAFDLGMGGVSVTPAREAQGAFSVPYLSGGKTIIARCRDAPRYHDGVAAVDHGKVRVIVNPGGTNEQFVRDNIHHATIVVFPDNRAIFDELAAGRADVMITDDVEAELQARRHPELCRVFPGTLTHSDKAVFMSRDAELVKAVNDWLAPAVAAGEPARVLKEFLR